MTPESYWEDRADEFIDSAVVSERLLNEGYDSADATDGGPVAFTEDIEWEEE